MASTGFLSASSLGRTQSLCRYRRRSQRVGLSWVHLIHAVSTKPKGGARWQRVSHLEKEELGVSLDSSGDAKPPEDTFESSIITKVPTFNLAEFFSSRIEISERVKGLVLLNVMTFIMSTNFVVVKEAQTLIDPFSFSAARFVTAAIPFLPFIFQTKPDRQTIYAGLEIGLWSTLGYLTQGFGLMSTDASRVSFLSALTVVLVPIIVGLSGKGVSKLAWCSAAVAMLGVSLLSGPIGDASFSTGDALSVASAAFIALQVIRTEHYSRLLPSKSCLPVLGLSMVSVATFSTLMTLGMHANSIRTSLDTLSLPDLLSLENLIPAASMIPGKALLYTGFISTDVVLLLELIALKNVPSTDAAVIYTLEPVLGALWAYLLLGERWGPNGWIGAGLIILSSLAAQICGNHEDTKEAELE